MKSVKIDNCRGINKEQEITFNPNITILHGTNGNGKTSVLQSIEWCLTGSISDFKAPDFQNEDAFVNFFSEKKKAKVVLEFNGDGSHGEFIIERTRRSSRNSATTKSNSKLEVHIGSKTYAGEEAQNELFKKLGIQSGDYVTGFYIRQDSIRQVLQEKPVEISRGLDKILGTHHIRDLIDSMNIKTKINNARKSLEERIKNIERGDIAIANKLKHDAHNRRKLLLEMGINESQLRLDSAIEIANKLVEDSNNLSRRLEFEVIDLQLAGVDVGVLKKNIDRLIKHLDNLDKKRQEIYAERNATYNNISKAIESLENLKQSLTEFEGISIESLNNEQKNLSQKLIKIQEKQNELSRILPKLNVSMYSFQTSMDAVKGLTEKVNRSLQQFGDIQKHASLLDKEEDKLQHIEGQLQSFDMYESLVGRAIDYIRTTQADTCPVCDRPSNPEQLVILLQTKVQKEISNKIAWLTKEKEICNSRYAQIKRDLEDLKDNKAKLDAEQETINRILHEVSALIRETVNTNFDFNKKIDDMTKESTANSKELLNTTTKLNKIKQDVESITRLSSSKLAMEQNLQQCTGSRVSGNELIEEAKSTLQKVNAESYGIEGEYAVKINDIKKDANSLSSGPISFLEQNEKAEEALKEVNINSELKQILERKKGSLDAFEGSLTAIKEVATNYLRNEVSNQIGKHGKLIDDIYNKIVAHPVFQHVSIDIQNRDPLTYTIKITENGAVMTSATTRFSMAQLNTFALSILIANNVKLSYSNSFAVLIMDDPTQSMDSQHKEALSKLIAEIGKDKQIIISTADEEFKSNLERNCKTYLSNVELTDWSKEGPIIVYSNS